MRAILRGRGDAIGMIALERGVHSLLQAQGLMPAGYENTAQDLAVQFGAPLELPVQPAVRVPGEPEFHQRRKIRKLEPHAVNIARRRSPSFTAGFTVEAPRLHVHPRDLLHMSAVVPVAPIVQTT